MFWIPTIILIWGLGYKEGGYARYGGYWAHIHGIANVLVCLQKEDIYKAAPAWVKAILPAPASSSVRGSTSSMMNASTLQTANSVDRGSFAARDSNTSTGFELLNHSTRNLLRSMSSRMSWSVSTAQIDEEGRTKAPPVSGGGSYIVVKSRSSEKERGSNGSSSAVVHPMRAAAMEATLGEEVEV